MVSSPVKAGNIVTHSSHTGSQFADNNLDPALSGRNSFVTQHGNMQFFVLALRHLHTLHVQDGTDGFKYNHQIGFYVSLFDIL